MKLQSFVILYQEEFKDFIGVCKIALQWMLTEERLTMTSMKAYPNQERLSFKEFISLCVEFSATNSLFRKEHKDVFVNIPMKNWVPKLHEIKSAAHVQDTQSVAHYIQVFNKKYQEAVKVVDMRNASPSIAVPLREFANRPNNLQMAVA